jgi:hypothetical protein
MGSVCFHWMPALFHWVSNRFLVHKRSVHRLATRRLLSVFSYGITADVAALVAAGLAPEALLAVTDTVSVFPASPTTGV